jgi:hypothetical protein
MLNIIYHYIIKLLKFVNNLNLKLLDILNQKVHNTTQAVQIIQVEMSTTGRFLNIWFTNNHLLDSYDVLREIFYTLKSNKEFINFGVTKVIIISAITDEKETSFLRSRTMF